MKDARALVEEASGGSSESVEALLERHLPRAHAIVRKRMGRFLRAREESLDVVQSVCRQVLESKEAYEHRSDEHFRRWLVEVVENKIVDHYRRQSAQRRDVAREEGTPESGAAAEISAHTPSPASLAGGKEELEQLREAIGELPIEERQALELAHFGGASYEEVAERMGLTYKQARRRVQQAKLALGQILKRTELE